MGNKGRNVGPRGEQPWEGYVWKGRPRFVSLKRTGKRWRISTGFRGCDLLAVSSLFACDAAGARNWNAFRGRNLERSPNILNWFESPYFLILSPIPYIKTQHYKVSSPGNA
jgi:hypothetical protein